jgi:D-2-hydroxyacid dehydrogenase (NADP+)
MNVLILGSEHDAYTFKSLLTADFPDVNFFAAREEGDAGDFLEKADILLCLRCSDAFIAKAKNLKWIQCIISGTNYIEELPSFQARKEIILTSARGIHGPQLSELCIMLMIAMNRKFPQFVKNQDKRIWDRWPTSLLWNKKVGILGVGVIGEAIARKCKAFEMTVLGIDIVQRKLDCVDEFFGLDKLHDVAI